MPRRRALLSFAALAAAPAAAEDAPWTRVPAAGEGKRPAVLILHGSRGLELNPAAYERYARALAATGIDAWLVRYLSPADRAAVDPAQATPEARRAWQLARLPDWSRIAAGLAADALARPESAGRVGLLGFSLGGFVAAGAAVAEARVAALAVLYGGLPQAALPRATHLPPVLVLHGGADTVVPVAEGEALAHRAIGAGAAAELVVYPGRGHGFDFAARDPASADALARVISFFAATLAAPQ